jgi:hypothetical protein
VIYPANYISIWTIAHISVEILEFPPTLTDPNAAFAVAFKIAVVGVVAALQHIAPRIVGAGPALSVYGMAFEHLTPARLGVAAF